MNKVISLTAEAAKNHFLKGSSYFNGDLPKYISFEPILNEVDTILGEKTFFDFKQSNPDGFSNVNYNFIANKDGRLAWRPYELMHPAIYVSLINLICAKDNWEIIKSRFSSFEQDSIICCSLPIISITEQSDQATQISSWWQQVEQQSLALSLDYTHLLHTDVTDCYGSLYTHSISWALHGFDEAKSKKKDKNLLGNKIDSFIQMSRHGQTNGISQGSVLMDFIAELVLGYVDVKIHEALSQETDYKILRYRDDYRIFTNSDNQAERILKTISDNLRLIGMKLGVSKTLISKNVVEGSVKPDKLAGIYLENLDVENAKTIQKQLLRLHAFGQKFPNSGALKRLVSNLHTKISKQNISPDDLEVQVAIATDISVTSPSTFPAIAGILSHLIFLAPSLGEKMRLWDKVRKKMERVPYNGYLEVWLQRVIQPHKNHMAFNSTEPICKIVNGENIELWNSAWISSKKLKDALKTEKLVDQSTLAITEIIYPDEVSLFIQNSYNY